MLHEEIKAARLRRRMSVHELARRSGVARKCIETFEAGGNVQTRTIEKLLAVLPEAGTPTLTERPVFPAAQFRALLDTVTDLLSDGLRLLQHWGADGSKTESQQVKKEG